ENHLEPDALGRGIRRSTMGLKKLCDIAEQPAEPWSIATVLLVQARSAPVQKENLEARFTQPIARMSVPSAVALDAMETDKAGARWYIGDIMSILPAIAVARRERFDGERRLTQRVAPCGSSPAPAPPGQ